MEPDDSNRLIDWAGNSFPYGVFVTYEQIHPDDAFGNVSVKPELSLFS